MCRAIHGVCHQPPQGKSSPLGSSEQCRHYGAKPYKAIPCEHAGTDKCPGMIREGNETDYKEYLVGFECTNPACAAYPRKWAPLEDVRKYTMRLMAELEAKAIAAGGLDNKTEGVDNPYGTGMEDPEFRQMLLDHGYDPWVPHWGKLDLQTAVPPEHQLSIELTFKAEMLYFDYRAAKRAGKPLPLPTDATRAPKSTEFNLQARYQEGGGQGQGHGAATPSGPADNQITHPANDNDEENAEHNLVVDLSRLETGDKAGGGDSGAEGGADDIKIDEKDVAAAGGDRGEQNAGASDQEEGPGEDKNDRDDKDKNKNGDTDSKAQKPNPYPRPDPNKPARRAPGTRHLTDAENHVLLWAAFETRPSYALLQQCLPDRSYGTISTILCRLKQEIVSECKKLNRGPTKGDDDDSE